ncbi:type IVB secretion system protein IcmH/DotU [Novosphingobium album (ex Liu et al. 2023)]|uniref:Type IVB secretion system protein IcmH/DotU n=1 Tax=Novosphingobium album (ex Liu et al. 2023) TaxID=3031130 RepID=A0ABT5WV32_9SPHN|nr:type IVB secretion system protein IcmH/DotU [Novosphingobium album (ex Liu et al. 2023)]MDE8653714.1 type IVB secretion system protein IcmH/DotU [Novosphingobium album (ex Liu et al. 2023)]
MSGGDSSNGGNRTVFRPSPLAGVRQGQGGLPPSSPSPLPQGGAFDQPPVFGSSPALPPMPGGGPQSSYPGSPAPYPGAQAPLSVPQADATWTSSGQLRNDADIPIPARPVDSRSPLVMEAGPVLALAASVRSGRARVAMPTFHRQASQAIAAYDRAIAPLYPDEVRQRARYALCATIDDIAQNLPNVGQDGAEWARRSLVVMFFREVIGGDRFWQLVDDLLARPAQNADLIELYAACLAAGFEGRFRVMPDGRARLQQIMHSLYGALEHPRSQSSVEIAPRWRGADAPLARISPWNRLLLAGAVALAGLLLVYIALRLLLASAGSPAWDSVRALTPEQPLRFSRVGTAPPAPAESVQLSRLRRFLEPEIREGLVAVEEDASTVRVRTTVGQLFESGSDKLVPGREALFQRIGRAIEEEAGGVTIEGHADSDKITGLAFPDNTALSRARAQTVADIVGSQLSDARRIRVEGFGDSRPIASNDTADGKSQNRRVEIVVPRRQ